MKCKKCGKEFDPIAGAIAANAINVHHSKRTVCFECVPYKKRKDRVRQNEICRYCKKEYVIFTYFNGKKKWCPKRHACFECVPYVPGTSFVQSKNTLDGRRECSRCKLILPLSAFRAVSKKKSTALNSNCRICDNKKKVNHGRKFKKECIDYKGGSCIVCGYNKCLAALEFHHRDPKEKEFSVSSLNTAILTDFIKSELDKCDLVCSNCHKEIHYLLI